jgi:hypothetical protein
LWSEKTQQKRDGTEGEKFAEEMRTICGFYVVLNNILPIKIHQQLSKQLE